MTTTVVVHAHCGDGIEVRITTYESLKKLETLTIQDGETADRVVFDDRRIIVSEVYKKDST